MAGISRAKPSVGRKRLGCRLRFVEIAAHHRRPLNKNLVFSTYLHLNLGHDSAYRAYDISHFRETCHRGSGFRQPVTDDDIKPHAVEKRHNRRRQRSSGRREDIAVVYAYGLAYRTKNALVKKLVAAFKQSRHPAPETHIVKVTLMAGLECVHHQLTLERRHLQYLLLYGEIGLLPESGHTAHAGRTHRTYCFLNLLGVMVDGHIHAPVKAEIRPCLLKNMAQRQETERCVIFAERSQTFLVYCQCCVKARVRQYGAFRLSRST